MIQDKVSVISVTSVISVMGCAEKISDAVAATMTIIFPGRIVSLMHRMIQSMFVCISCRRW